MKDGEGEERCMAPSEWDSGRGGGGDDEEMVLVTWMEHIYVNVRSNWSGRH